MTTACIVFPLLLTRRSADARRRRRPICCTFAAIGLGFMLIEISQLQRLTIFLGHPAYSLSVVLFSLLVSSGIGSLSTGRVQMTDALACDQTAAAVTLAVLVVFGSLTPADRPPVRVRRPRRCASLHRHRHAAAGGILHGHGVSPGHAPRAAALAAAIAPWLWGVNGATSVCASVLAVVIAIGAGISAAFWIGRCLLSGGARSACRCQIPSSKLQDPNALPTSNCQINSQIPNLQRGSHRDAA